MSASERVAIAEVVHLMAAGEPLPFRVFDAAGRLLLNEGQRVLGPSQLTALAERGAWVERSAVEAAQAALAAAASATPPASARRLSLFDRWEQALWDLDTVLRSLATGRGAAAGLDGPIDALVARVDRDADVALFVAHRHEDRRFAMYPIAHALHAATVALLAARQAGWPAGRQRSLVGAALSMNVAMIDLQAQMAEQKDPPTKKQIERIRAHPDAAVGILRAAGVADDTWLAAVRDHHESPDGKGYPRGVAEVPDEARLLRHADVYTAKITPRALRAALAPRVATVQLLQGAAQDPLAVALIRTVGAHPPGTLTRLASGEVAVVTRRGAQPATPEVSTLSDKLGRPMPQSTARQTRDPAFAITPQPVEANVLARVLPERVYGWIDG